MSNNYTKGRIIIKSFGLAFEESILQNDHFILVDYNKVCRSDDALCSSIHDAFTSNQKSELYSYIMSFVDPPALHTINIFHNFADVEAVKEAASAQNASFVFIGAIPEPLRELLAERAVRSATGVEDLNTVVRGILYDFSETLRGYLQKEYLMLAENMNPKEQTIVSGTQALGKYAERLFQSSKDIMKVIQTATGPISIPPMFARRASSGSREEAKKLVYDGFASLALSMEPVLEVILRKFKKLKSFEGLGSELELIDCIARNQRPSKIFLTLDAFKSVRIVAMSTVLSSTRSIDWQFLHRNISCLRLAALLAVLECEDDVASRYHRAVIWSLKMHSQLPISTSSPFKQQEALAEHYLPFDFPQSLSIISNELITVEFDFAGTISSFISTASCLSIQQFHQSGPACRLTMAAHLYKDQEIELHVHVREKVYKTILSFQVAQCVYLKSYILNDRQLLHLQNVSAPFKVRLHQDEQIITEQDTNYLIHFPLMPTLKNAQVVVQLSSGRNLFWDSLDPI